jgi:5-methyltetrahydropteroyltriglutamate--homocysteine methyltransferase
LISGEFSLYDHVLDHSSAFNVIPKRYVGLGLSALDVFFAMGRGRQADGVDVPACEMKKWSVFCFMSTCPSGLTAFMH